MTTGLAEFMNVKNRDPSTIYLKNKSPWATIGDQLKRAENFPLPLKVLTSPTSTVVLSSVLGALTGTVGPGTALKSGFLGAGTSEIVQGAIKSSPTLDTAISKRVLNPSGVGETLGGVIEDVSKVPDKVGGFIGGGIEKGKDIINTVRTTTHNIFEKSKPFIIPTVGIVGGGLGLLGLTQLLGKREAQGSVNPVQAVAIPTVGSASQPIPEAPAKKKESPNIKITLKPKTENYINNIIQVV